MARRFIRPRLSDQQGNVLSGGWLRVLAAGTDTEVDLFAASAGGAALTQPRTTDARGEVECWLADGTGDVDLEWSDSGATYKGGTTKRVTFDTFSEFVDAPVSGGGSGLHADLTDLATSGHPAAVISGLGSAALQASSAFDPAGAAAGAQAASQPLDSDLTAIAALSTTVYGRGFLALADAAAGQATLGLGSAATYSAGAFDAAGAAAAAQAASQPLDSDLTAIAALSTTAFGRALLTLADAAAGRTALSLGGAAVLNVGTTAGTVAAGDDSRITGAVPASLVDAAGDLLVGSAADTVARLPMGSALQVLRVNSGATAPEWAAVSSGGIQPTSAVVGGNYYPIAPTGFEGNAPQAITASTLQMFQWVVQQDCTVTELWIDVTSGGGAGKKASVGIYTASTTWVPSLLLDAGQLDVASTGIKKATSLGQALTAGQYWLAIHAEANMSLRTVYGGMSHAFGSTGTLNGAATWATTATFGTLPASPTPAITNNAHEWNMVFPVVTR